MQQLKWRGAVILAVLAALTAHAPSARAQATSQPSVAASPSASPSTAPMRPGPAYIIRRYKTAVDQLQLSDDEKTKVDGVFNKVNQQGLDLSANLGDLPFQQRYQKLSAFSQQIRQELAGVLTEQEMKDLDSKVGSAFAGPGRRARAAAGNPNPANSTSPDNTDATNAGSTANSTPGATPPPQAKPGRRAGGGAAMLTLVQQSLDKLDLSDDQRKQIGVLMDDTRLKIEDIRQNATNADSATPVQQQLQQVRRDLREKLQTILTPEQYQSFTESMRQAFQQRGGAAGGPRVRADAPISSKPVMENKPEDLTQTGPEAGSPAPNIQILEANGREFNPSIYKGRVVVLEFGSMSCPVFRSHVQDMEKLKLAEGGRAFFLIVYTREAFPAGDKNVERNRQEGISVTDASTIDDCKAQALETQQELRITIPMALDSMDDAVSNAFGGFPNGAVVIGKDGNIAARQQWTNPDTLRQVIDDAFAAPMPIKTN